MTKTLLVDLTKNRMGIFSKTTLGKTANRINVHYHPVAFMMKIFGERIIYEVSEDALTKPFELDESGNRVVYLVSGEFGKESFLDSKLGIEISKGLESFREMKEKSAVERALASRKTRIADSKEGVVLKDAIENIKQIMRTRPYTSGKGKPDVWWDEENES